jgi:hypothetical protein
MGKIIKDFDIDALVKERARKAASGGDDLVTALGKIAPEVAELKVGETAQIDIPGANATEKKGNLRKTVMGITAKLSNLTAKGGDWAGRRYKVVSDGEASVYVQRVTGYPAGQAPERKRGGGGGRKKKTATTEAQGSAPAGDNASEGQSNEGAGDSTTLQNGAKVTEHA